ncbi:MAG: MobC family plasmid mobilization relaxosome protein [Prevotella sp.]|nr:MobC family plasmid mobilization relaxosome protein [Prevotella sp.]
MTGVANKLRSKAENKGGRPRKRRSELRSHHVKAGFNDSEFDTVCRKAQEAGEQVSEYVRKASLNATVKAHINDEQLELIRNIARMGNNVNQLAKQANAAGFASAGNLCIRAVTRLLDIIETLYKGEVFTGHSG